MSTITRIVKTGQNNARNNARNQTLGETYLHSRSTQLTLTILPL